MPAPHSLYPFQPRLPLILQWTLQTQSLDSPQPHPPQTFVPEQTAYSCPCPPRSYSLPLPPPLPTASSFSALPPLAPFSPLAPPSLVTPCSSDLPLASSSPAPPRCVNPLALPRASEHGLLSTHRLYLGSTVARYPSSFAGSSLWLGQ